MRSAGIQTWQAPWSGLPGRSSRFGESREQDRRASVLTATLVPLTVGVAGGWQYRRKRRTALLESLSGAFQQAWASSAPDDWKPDALRGNWSPVHEEVADLSVEVVHGELPIDFPAGRFIRNGPNPRWVRPLAAYHPFEGDGMIHSLEIKPPSGSRGHHRQVCYSNGWVKTAKWFAEDTAQMLLISGMVDDQLGRAAANAMFNAMSIAMAAPAVSQDDRVQEHSKSLGTANTSVIVHAGKCMALQERSNPVIMDMSTLETQGPLDLGGKFTAHPKVCSVTGELMWFSYHDDGIDYGVWDKHGVPVHETTVELPHSIMAHDFAVTERHTILMDCPLLFQPENILKGKGPVEFKKEYPVRFGVLPRHGQGADVEWYTLPGCGKACFHVMNAYEEPSGEIVIIGCSMPDVTLLDCNVKYADLERITEWKIDRETRQVHERVLSNVPCDFPVINANVAGKPFRFGYAAAFDTSQQHGGVPMFRGILKHDFISGESMVWKVGEGSFVGEPTFVPRLEAEPGVEDDGYLLVHAFHEVTKVSEVLVLDARRFGSDPICRMRLPRRVPYGFHATWVPA